MFCFDRVGETSEIEEERVDKTKLEYAHTMDRYRTAANEFALSEIANDNFIGMLSIVTK